MQRGFSSRRNAERIGSFLHGLAIVEANASDDAIALREKPASVTRLMKDPRTLLRLLLELTSVAHERVHYLDTYGTFAGISLFQTQLEAVRHFLEVGAQLAARGIPWQLPLADWAKQPDCPAEVRELQRFARAYERGSDIFLAPFSQFGAPGATSDAWVHLPFKATPDSEPVPTLAFPLSFGLAAADGSQAPELATIFQPVGYEAIVEGRAHSIARSLIDSQFPLVPPDFMVRYGSTRAMTREGPLQERIDRATPWFEIYNTTDLLVSKSLRRHGIATFPRNLVLRLSDIALSQSWLSVRHGAAGTTEVAAVNPAGPLVEMLTATDPKALHSLDFAYPPLVDKLYRQLLDDLGQGGDWDTVTPPDSPYVALRMWESFVAQNITIPLLRKRLATNHACFDDAEQVLATAMFDELPRIEVLNGQFRFKGVPPEVQKAWGIQMFLGEVAHQVFDGATTIRCPRAHEMVPGMKSTDFSGGQCAKLIGQGCGSCTQGRALREPPCLFTRTLRLYGLLGGNPGEPKGTPQTPLAPLAA